MLTIGVVTVGRTPRPVLPVRKREIPGSHGKKPYARARPLDAVANLRSTGREAPPSNPYG
jgi:hypothetical protein